jgi:hypothetical protein
VVDRGLQVTEEPLKGCSIRGIEGRGTQRFELARGPLKALRIPAGENYLRTFRACSSRRFETDAASAPNYDNGLPEEFRFALE